VVEITIKGPRGAGKSVLARHLAEYLKDQGHDVTISTTVDKAHAHCTVKHRIRISEAWSR